MVGCLAVVEGVITPALANLYEKDEAVCRRWTGGPAQVKFVLPEGVGAEAVIPYFNDAEHVTDVEMARRPRLRDRRPLRARRDARTLADGAGRTGIHDALLKVLHQAISSTSTSRPATRATSPTTLLIRAFASGET